MIYQLIFSILVLPLLISCHKKNFFESVLEDAEIQNKSEMALDSKIPMPLWDLIEGKSPMIHGDSQGHQGTSANNSGHGGGSATPANSGGHGGGSGGSSGGHGGGAPTESGSNNIQIVFGTARVYLAEKNSGILTQSEQVINFPRGGGQVNLSDFVTNKTGTFFVGLDIPEVEGLTDLKIYFVSRARKRKVDQEIIGSGCNVFFDITDRFGKEMKKQGLKVNTLRQRHVSVLAGDFVIVGKKEKQTIVTKVSFTDSNNPNLLCEVAHDSNSHL